MDNNKEMSEPGKEVEQLDDIWMNYDTSLGRAWMLHVDVNVNLDTMLYFYSALEMRFAIEDILFKLLIKKKNGKISKNEYKIYKPNDFDSLLKTIDPKYFTSSKELLGFDLKEDDIIKIKIIYGKLGTVLHLPKDIYYLRNQENWKDNLEDLVQDSLIYLNNLTGKRWPIT